MVAGSSEWPPLLWPWEAWLSSAGAALDLTDSWLRGSEEDSTPPGPIPWCTPNRVVLDSPLMRLRAFSDAVSSDKAATVVVGPYAVHAAEIADLAPGHSLVAVLSAAGLDPLFLIDWRSATPETRESGIDTLLSNLDAAVGHVGGRANLIGLCQGGWLSLIYAALFPEKVRSLVLVGSPVVPAAAPSFLTNFAYSVPLSVYESVISAEAGLVRGQGMLQAWGGLRPGRQQILAALQVEPSSDPDAAERFRQWNAFTLDLPGTYFLQVVQWLFKENRLAQGGFPALGREVDLSRVAAPVFLLAGRDDDAVPPQQLFASEDLLHRAGVPVETGLAPGGHLALFMGREVLHTVWPRVAAWVAAGGDQS